GLGPPLAAVRLSPGSRRGDCPAPPPGRRDDSPPLSVQRRPVPPPGPLSLRGVPAHLPPPGASVTREALPSCGGVPRGNGEGCGDDPGMPSEPGVRQRSRALSPAWNIAPRRLLRAESGGGTDGEKRGDRERRKRERVFLSLHACPDVSRAVDQ